jgi:dihydropteroate synthase
VILMHKQDNPQYGDVVAEVIAFLKARAAAAEHAGVAKDNIWIDPGVGGGMFGKTSAQCLTLIGAIQRIKSETGRKLLFGASRKSFIGALDGSPADKRLGGSVAAALLAAQSGADMVRVHDVHETVQALKLWRAVNE